MAAVLIVLGYLCGTIPTGVLLARSAGVDVRRVGSGNVGATNVLRNAGLRLGVLTLIGDALKGLVPVLVARHLIPDGAIAPAVGVAAVLGHVFPATLGFRGGKGVATALGVLLALAPAATAGLVAVFAATVGIWGYVSLGSMITAGLAPLVIAFLGYPRSTLVASAAVAACILLRHRENLARLAAGTEPPIRLPKKQALPRN